jgi:ABC-2 type transport system ATP-binding protein
MDPLIVTNVSKTFPTKNGEVKALQDISFEVKRGEIFGLLGPNGAGKTTLMNVMLNLLTPDTGSVTILCEKPGPKVFSRINLIAGGSEFHWALQPKDILNFYATIYQIKNPQKKIAELVKLLKIEDLMERKFSWLSTGERLRVAFAKALLNDPTLLLMDEPTLGLDPDVAKQVRKEILRLNKEKGMTILLTSHYMQEVEQLCDRIAFISKGKIIDIGEVKEVKLKHFSTYDVKIRLDKKAAKGEFNIHGCKVNGDKMSVTLKDEESLSELLSQIHQQGYKIKDIEVSKPTLEDYFIKVANRK